MNQLEQDKLIHIMLLKSEWVRVALALHRASTEYMRESRYAGQPKDEPSNQDRINRSQQAKDLCNYICDHAGLEDVFRCD